MIYENIELHNVAEVHPVSCGDGVRLQRYPEDVRIHLSKRGQERALNPDNAEIRFLSDSPKTSVTVSSEGETSAMLFYGDFDARQRFVAHTRLWKGRRPSIKRPWISGGRIKRSAFRTRPIIFPLSTAFRALR